jgi:hypothetical protein
VPLCCCRHLHTPYNVKLDSKTFKAVCQENNIMTLF